MHNDVVGIRMREVFLVADCGRLYVAAALLAPLALRCQRCPGSPTPDLSRGMRQNIEASSARTQRNQRANSPIDGPWRQVSNPLRSSK